MTCDPRSAGLATLSDVECQPGSTFEPNADEDWLCVDMGLLGDFCEANSTCDGGLFCDISTGQ